MIIDLHNHIVPEDFPASDGRASGDRWPRMEPKGDGSSAMIVGGKTFRVIKDVCWNSGKRTADLSRIGVEKQVLSPLPELLMYDLEPQDGADMARHLNDTIAAMVEQEPERYYGLGTVPMQDVEMAVAELSHVRALGLRGVEIRTNVRGKNLGDLTFRPLFREAAALGLSVLVHAYNPTYRDRLEHPHMQLPPEIEINGLGFPIECALAGASLIWGGVLAECPDLRVCMSHGGGALVQLMARSNFSYGRREELRAVLPETPMDYARSLYYDNITFSLANMRYLIDNIGASQVVVGTDYSGQSVKEMKPEDEFEALRLSKDERDAIGYRNALRFLGVGA